MSTRINLDLDTLRTFLFAHELGGLAQAAQRLGRTPSAISLQMKRLQDDLGAPLFRKHGRGLVLTEAGEVVLGYVRKVLALHDELLDTVQTTNVAGQIRIGCPQDFASILPSILSHFSSLYPRMQIELFVEGNAALAEGVERSRIDLAIVIGHDDRSAAATIGEIEVVWIAGAEFVRPKEMTLPLAVLGPQCAFRKRAIEALEREGIAYRIAANSPSLDGLWGALLGGLGVTARTAFHLPDGLVSAASMHGLPQLGVVPVTLHRNESAEGAAVELMSSLLLESIAFLLSSKAKVVKMHSAEDRPKVSKKA